MTVIGADLLDALRKRNWKIEPSRSTEPLLPTEVQQRYPRLPEEITRFLEFLESCVNEAETVWFLCREDYRRTDGESFRWNEFELITLEEADEEHARRVRSFWDAHFPIMLAVHSDYDYIAVSLEERTYGQIVHGSGPEFEETSLLAPTFAEFLVLFGEEAVGTRESYPLSHFL